MIEKTNKKERFTLTQLPSGLWEGRDIENGIIVTFREHQFDTTKKVSIEETSATLNNVMSAEYMSPYLDELEYWLRHNHYNTLMPSLLDKRVAIGRRIQQLRVDKGMTIDELAWRAGITKGNVFRIEAGKYSTGLDLFNRIATVLGVKFDFFPL